MPLEIIVELIKIIPSILWFIFGVVLLVRLYEPIKNELLPRMSGLKVFGVEATFIEAALEKAAKKRDTRITSDDLSRIERRLLKNASLLRRTHLLWVDDSPQYIEAESRILRAFNVSIDIVTSTSQALVKLQQEKYDLVISDIERNGISNEGITFVKEMQKRQIFLPTILYVGALDESRGTPPYAFAITDRVDELFHYVLDIIEREKS